ncbi:ABC transporter substrate-binding protein [Nocardia cerradoensis]|uniref:Putative aliphatic sulfonates-binding protein n=1 Tax=Nocardia cerradoensis TaxID=85688 RepID=A0A231GWC1_9NOCA|nr:ABC transporter substrate-binding protein [Nocardia cerradoensis]NKY43809.1 ABC transporter substrate-binding protein [Nocardia cerradoensis]OXR40930.1 putative aliphatic sulfonates-binding protein [Nocardia cerradoensis]
MIEVLRRRVIAGAVVVAALVLATTACARPATQATGNASDLVRISVGVDASYAPFFLADSEGMFAAAGLHVQIIQTEGGAASAQNVVAGTSELSGNADSTALTVMAGNPGLRALGVYEDSDRYFRVVLRGGATPKSIRKMGVFPGIGLYFTDRYLRSLGVDPASITLVTTSPPEQPALLARGDIDAFISYDPWVARAVGSNGHVVGTTGDFGARYSQWLLASQSWLSTHERLAGQVFRVLAQAADIIAADPSRAAKAVAAAIRMDPGEARDQITQIDFRGRDFRPDDFEQARELVDFFRGQGKLAGPVPPQEVMLAGWFGRNTQ